MIVPRLPPEPHRHDTGLIASGGTERRTWIVIALTSGMMVAEVSAGWLFGSMALLADGWHMASHAAALGITVLAYRVARLYHDDPRFNFGTGKVGVLGGYTSAVVLAVIALAMFWASIERLLSPRAIAFDEALLVAIVGLVTNLVSAWVLVGGSEHHEHEHGRVRHQQGHPHRDEGHAHRPDDHNLRGAYLHVLADALTSVLAIVALTVGKVLGWWFFDPLMGIVGGVLVLRWSWGLLRDSGWILLDGRADAEAVELVRTRIERLGALAVRDLHLWYLSPRHLGVIVSVDAADDSTCDQIREVLHDVPGVTHVTIEIRRRDPAARGSYPGDRPG
ncbi:MAG: CDF family Co(II)/Ni(II) efflux transporter DmeF [Polyangiaceae bacterium]|nr:CDF family Co(II)/Ni(II) efflux transporter DmeF [Polyangiaceae bacterium]